MLHLFKRIYLSIDETLDISNNRLVYSRDYGHVMGIDYQNVGTLLKYSASIDDVIGHDREFNNYLHFFDYLNTQHDTLDSVIVVYADRESFVKIGTNFFKALLPLANAGDIYRVLMSYAARQNLLATSPNFEMSVMNLESFKYKAAFTEAEVSAEFFQSRTNPVDFYNFFNNKRSQLSVELIAATYSYNGKCKNEVSELIKSFCIKHAYMYALEARQEIADTCMTKHTQTVMNLAAAPVADMAGIIKNAASTEIFFRDSLFPKNGSAIDLDANWRQLSTADMSKLCRMSIKVLRDISLWREDSDDTKLSAQSILTALQDIHNPAAWEQKLDLFINNLPEIAIEGEPNKVNAILLYHIRDTRLTNRQQLRPFVVNGCQ